MYPLVHLKPFEGEYDSSIIEADLLYLKSKGKKLLVQLQDVTFNTTLFFYTEIS